MVQILCPVLVIVIGVQSMSEQLKFVKGEWYKHKKWNDLLIRIIKRVTAKTYQIEYYTLGYDRKTPRSLGVFNTYFFNGDEDWELFE